MKNLSWVQVVTHVMTLLIGLAIGYFTWNVNSKIDQTNPTSTVTTVTPTPSADKLTPKGIDSLSIQTKKEDIIADAKSSDTDEEIAKLPTSSKPISRNGLERTKMGISDKKIGEILSSIAQNLEDKKLEYRSDLLQDCSGIFHQMKDSLQKRLPALAEGLEYQYPSSKSVRNTRQIADWFYKNKNLLIVEDAMASRNSIRPGAVMFYGKSNKTFKNIDIDMLTDRANNYTSNGAIMHIAVVTSVTTDEENNVIDYTIMHGRNPRNHASRTGSKAVQSTRTKGLPPFGNWSQQLVAIANIATPK